MWPRLTADNIKNLEQISLEGCDYFGTTVIYFNELVSCINLLIENADHCALTPYMKMLAQVGSFIDTNADRGHISKDQCDDINNAMIWLFNEMAPEGFIFDKTGFVQN